MAFEEAGVVGYVSSSSIGMFPCDEAYGKPVDTADHRGRVYLFEVIETLPDWPATETPRSYNEVDYLDVIDGLGAQGDKPYPVRIQARLIRNGLVKGKSVLRAESGRGRLRTWLNRRAESQEESQVAV